MQPATIRSPQTRRNPAGLTLFLVVAVIAVALCATVPASASPISSGDGTWSWQSPLPQGNDLNDVAFADSGRGWTVGDCGTILRSDDGGATWSGDRSGTGADLYGAAVASAHRAWAVGASGTILTTTDGGATWAAQASGVAADLRAVTALSVSEAWAVGDAGTALHTVDGGATWSLSPTACDASLLAVEFADAASGWASGAGGALIHTSNGGATWAAQDWAGALMLGPDDAATVELRSLSFVDAHTGWAAGAFRFTTTSGYSWLHDQVFMRTSDGGATWSPMPDTIVPWLTMDMAFVDSRRGWVVTLEEMPEQTVHMFRTTDAGQTWSMSWGRMALEPGGVGDFAVSLDVRDDGRACLTGEGGAISRASDGAAWAAVAPGSYSGDELESVAFADDETGWAAGHWYTVWTEPVLKKTTDAGRTWVDSSLRDVVQGGWLHGISCAGVDTVVAVGEELEAHNVVVSHDGGDSWTSARAGYGRLDDVDLVSAARGWAVGDDVYRTADGGSTWQLLTTGAPGPFAAVDFVDADTGWIAGAGGTILRSDDGGASWTPQSSGTTAALHDLAFFDRSAGWAVGAGGTLLRTANGGETWAAVSLDTSADLTAVAVSGATVRIAGSSGTAAVSHDSGSTWTLEMTGTSRDFFGLATSPSGRAWVVGAGFTILTTSEQPVDQFAPSTVDDVPAGWVNHAVTVTLTATDTGSGIAHTEYRLDAGDWTIGTSVKVAAPPDHSGDGIHTIAYRSVDRAGNVEPAHDCLVRVDTRAPVVVAPAIVFVRYGQPAGLACTVLDAQPNGGSVIVTASGIRASRRPWSIKVAVTPGEPATLPLPEGLLRGAYRVRLTARDTAGNVSPTAVKVLLIVR